MPPSAYIPFFSASMGAAAALLGLLFVSVSVDPERTVGAGAPVERRIVAESVFTALIDAFFVSMGGTLPGNNLGVVALVLSAFALLQTLRAARVVRPQRLTLRTAIQRLSLVLVALVIYGLQLSVAFQLIAVPPKDSALASMSSLIFALYAFALGRSWELLGARRGIFWRRISPIVGDDGQPGATSSTQPTTSVPSPAPAVGPTTPDNSPAAPPSLGREVGG
jgi:hypothetical protein